MSLKDTLSALLQNREELLSLRLTASKNVFLILTFVFFLNYFFVGTGFKKEIFVVSFPYIYVLFILAYLLYIFFLILYYFRGKMGIVGILIFVVFALIF
jgi:hypothetical protein